MVQKPKHYERGRDAQMKKEGRIKTSGRGSETAGLA